MSNFWRSPCCSFYESKSIGYLWVRIFGLKFSFKNLKKYDLKNETPKGFKLGHWLITKIN